MPKNISIVTARRILMEKWWRARTLTAKDNGSIRAASIRRFCQTNGTASTVPSKKTKQGIVFQEVFSLIKKHDI